MLLSRRVVLRLLASTQSLPALAITPTLATAGNANVRLFVLSDLHSGYERLGQLLAAIDEAARAGSPSLILINGDVFEYGNVVARRSKGTIDWAFLQALQKRAPVILNLGNHEPDLVDDLVEFVEQARSTGALVLSNIRDSRTGKPYAAEKLSLQLGDQGVSIFGLGTNAIATDPKVIRPTLDIPDPVLWAKRNLPEAMAPGSFNIVMSHAGVVADRNIVPLLPDGTLLVGGHDHLLFEHRVGQTCYFHTGSWCTSFTIADVTVGKRSLDIRVERVAISADAPSSPELAGLIEATLNEHTTPDERAIIGRNSAARTLGETGRFVAGTIAERAGGTWGLIAHTTFGTGLPAGDVSKYAFDSVLRFDGDLMVAEVEEDVLKNLLAISNQDGDLPLDLRRGDFVYAAPASGAQAAPLRIVVNDWVARNQEMYLGRNDLRFAKAEGIRLKPVVLERLARR